MPDSGQIVENLERISANGLALATIWHVYVGGILVALLAGWRPVNRIMALALTPLLWSAGALAALYGNPFNAIVFFGLGAAATMIAFSMTPEPIHFSPIPFRFAGMALILFGWVYPHFVPHADPLIHLYGAPLGLLPCPTLSFVIGMGILAAGFRNRPWMRMFSAAGAFYGFYGAAMLGVQIDALLAAGAFLLAVNSLRTPLHRGPVIEHPASSS
jgi:hypothetical protein